MKDTRIVFMGTPSFASNILCGLIENDYNIVLVVSQPDKKVGRKNILTPSPVKELAIKNNIDVFTPNSIRKEFQSILDYKPDLILTAAYGQIIPNELLNYPKYKCINVHGSLLPNGRGGAPIQRSIINGDTKTGISIMFMNEKMDEGDILVQKSIDIDIHDTSTTLFNKLSNLGLKMLLDFLPNYFNDSYTSVKQDNSLATYSYNLNKEDEFICFNDNVLNVYNHIRGLLDNPGPYFVVEDKKIKIIDAFFEFDENVKTNTIIGLEKDYFRIDCLDGYIKIYKIKVEGKNTIDAKNFYNGIGRTLVGLKPKEKYE